MLYKYAWTPSFKGTHSLITDLTLGELWLTWASKTLMQVTPPESKLTCINREEANWEDNGLHDKVTLMPNLSYLFSAGTEPICKDCINNWASFELFKYYAPTSTLLLLPTSFSISLILSNHNALPGLLWTVQMGEGCYLSIYPLVNILKVSFLKFDSSKVGPTF